MNGSVTPATISSSIDITFKDGIEALLLEEVPGVIGVELVL